MNHTRITEALPQALQLRLGNYPKNAIHPDAHDLSQWPLKDLVEAAGRYSEPATRNAFASGLHSQDFGQALATAIGPKILTAYRAVTSHRIVCHDIEARDYKPLNLPSVELSDNFTRVSELGEIPSPPRDALRSRTAEAQLTVYARKITISRETILNDNLGFIADSLTQVGADVARLEHRLAMNLLNTNPVMSDGANLFDNALGTNVVDSGVFPSSMETAISTLMQQKTTGGNNSLLRPYAMIIPPWFEMRSRKVLAEAGLDLHIVVSPEIEGNKWFLLADPSVAPVLGRLHLKGNHAQPYKLEHFVDFRVQGTTLILTADMGFSLIKRTGIVRITEEV